MTEAPPPLQRTCTCHPDDKPTECRQRFAASECRAIDEAIAQGREEGRADERRAVVEEARRRAKAHEQCAEELQSDAAYAQAAAIRGFADAIERGDHTGGKDKPAEDRVEQVARALAEADGCDWKLLRKPGMLGTPRFGGKDYWFNQARAAIAAIPTDPPPDYARELAEALGYAASLLNPVWDQGATVTQADLDMGRLRSLNQALAAALTKCREHHNGR